MISAVIPEIEAGTLIIIVLCKASKGSINQGAFPISTRNVVQEKKINT